MIRPLDPYQCIFITNICEKYIRMYLCITNSVYLYSICYIHYYFSTYICIFFQYFFSLIEFAFAFFICELKRLFRPFHEFLFVPRQPLWPTILSNKHKPAQGLCAEFMVRHIVCNFQVGGLAIV